MTLTPSQSTIRDDGSTLSERVSMSVPLAGSTTLEVGGPAHYFVEIYSESDVADAVDLCGGSGLNLFILGGGSNVLISDNGFDGLVAKIAIMGRQFDEISDGKTIVTAGAGEVWDDLVADCVSRDLAGIECLSGIPGLVGGTPIQNVGAYGQDVSETIVSVRCFDRSSNQFVELSSEQCGFEYRSSIFNSVERDRYVVTSVQFALTRSDKPKIAYRDLISAFEGREPTLQQVRDTVIRIRLEKSMVIHNDDPNRRSAGSFFKNPVVSSDAFAELQAKFPTIPSFQATNGVKTSAAWLIENAGFAKGYRSGNVGISSKHSLAVVNLGNATAVEIVDFRDRIIAAVRTKFGISLQQEPVLVGFPVEPID